MLETITLCAVVVIVGFGASRLLAVVCLCIATARRERHAARIAKITRRLNWEEEG